MLILYASEVLDIPDLYVAVHSVLQPIYMSVIHTFVSLAHLATRREMLRSQTAGNMTLKEDTP